MSLGLDHSAMIARYDVAISIRKECIPRDRFFSGWVISRSLEMDDSFLENSRLIFKLVMEDLLKNSDVTLDPSFYWLKAKTAIISLAKKREKDLFISENEKIEVLKGFYFSALNDMKNGIDCLKEIDSIKIELDKIYQERSKRKVDKMRGIQINDHSFDIHKLQNQRKYENLRKINEIKIGGTFTVEQKMWSRPLKKKCERNLSHTVILISFPLLQRRRRFFLKHCQK